MNWILSHLAFASVVLCSCVGSLEYTATTAKGDREHFLAKGILGGSEAFELAGGTRWTANRNKSFGQGAQAATAIAAGIGSVAVQKSNNALTAAQDANAASTAQSALKAKESVTNAAISAGAVPTVNAITPP